METATSAENKVSRYGSSCNSCRRRKQRCDSILPICSRCAKSGEECVYEGNMRRGTSSQLVPVVADMVSFLRGLISPDFRGGQSDMVDCIRSYLNSLTIPEAGLQPLPATEGQPSQDTEQYDDEGDPLRTQIDELLMQMSIQDDGQNGHFGLTSFVWQTPSADVLDRLQARIVSQQETAPDVISPTAQQKTPSVQGLAASPDRNGEVWVTDGKAGVDAAPDPSEAGSLRATATMLGNWENLAFHKLQLEHDVETATMMITLMKTYFSWRDMALGGQYFNNFLLSVICASAVRFSNQHFQDTKGSGMRTPRGNSGPDFLASAKQHLMEEIDRPTSIPTIQGLLLLGQMECSAGHYSQGWLYTGMAFRAMRDLGIHLNIARLPIFGFGTLSFEDREIRRRLFWSAYTWDKIISLALGRYPTFNAFQNVSPGPIIDDTEDDDDWYPYTEDPVFRIELSNYPVQKALTTCTNRYFIKLCEIIQKIIGRLYNGRPKMAQSIDFARTMSERLRAWFADMPSSIKLDTANLPPHCPPPHIFSINVLYRASWILLYRVFLPNDLPFQSNAPPEIAANAGLICSGMAEEMHQLFTLHNKSFNLRNMTYTTSWSMSVDLIKRRLIAPVPRPIKRQADTIPSASSQRRPSYHIPPLPQSAAGPSYAIDDSLVFDESSFDALMSSWDGGNGGTGSMDLLQDMTAMPSAPSGEQLWQGNDWIDEFWRS